MSGHISGPGLYGVYKPLGISSYDVIRQLKRAFPGQKIGHGGTLDPLAEGVLVVAIGSAYTKQLSEVLKGTEKVYEAVVRLGEISETDDSEGPIKGSDPKKVGPSFTQPELEKILSFFVGTIQQTPPKYAAIKIGGVPAYKRARRGEEVIPEPKTVHIERIALLSYVYPDVTLEVTCGSGTYIRALARDMGEKLGCGAYLKALKRTRVGQFTAEEACVL